jgi:hypothetical protein
MLNLFSFRNKNLILLYIGSLDENLKVNQLEDDRFSRMEHFYGSDEIDPETLEDLDLGDDGKVKYKRL